MSAIYTIGYAGRDISGFLGRLADAGVTGVVDVRDRPYSRNRDFSRKALEASLAERGLDYISRPGLGIPSAERRNADSDEKRADLLARYRDQLSEREDLADLADQVRARPLALMCMESDPEHCHRGVLAAVLSERTGLPVEHL